MADRKTIGVSLQSQRLLDMIVENSLYRDQVDVAKFAATLALARGLEPSSGGELTTKWNVGTFDPAGQIKAAILAFRQGAEEPYRCAEGLIGAGLAYLGEHVSIHGTLDFEVLLSEISGEGVRGDPDEAEAMSG